MAFVSSTIASDLFTGTVAFEPLRITSKEVQERYNRYKEAHGERDRVKVAEICLDVLKSFNIPLEIQGLDVDRQGKEEVAYVVLDGRPKDKSLPYIYAKHLGRGYAAYVPFPKHYFEQKVQITVPKPDTGFDVRTFLCRHQVSALIPHRTSPRKQRLIVLNSGACPVQMGKHGRRVSPLVYNPGMRRQFGRQDVCKHTSIRQIPIGRTCPFYGHWGGDVVPRIRQQQEGFRHAVQCCRALPRCRG